LNHSQTEVEVGVAADIGVLEDTVKTLWDKARVISNAVSRLRDEKLSLSTRLVEMEKEVSTLRSDIVSKEQELKRLKSEQAKMMSSNSNEVFTDDERENLKSKIRELIAKINSYL
jgi:predicted  nucleic acid-binding Zn-ribbon protein